MVDSISDVISFLNVLTPMSPYSTLHRLNQVPNAFFPAIAFSSTMSFNSRCSSITHPKYSYWLTTGISTLSVNYILHICSLHFLLSYVHNPPADFCTFIFTPHSSHHATKTPKLFLIPSPSDSSNEVYAFICICIV